MNILNLGGSKMKRILILTFLLMAISLSADLSFGKDLFNDKLYEEAITEFEKVVADAPTSDAAQEAIFLIGQSYMAKIKFGRAENSFNKLIDGFPNLDFKDEVLHYLAVVQFDQKKYNKTIETCEILLNRYPLSEWTRKSLALYLNSFYELGEYNQVIIKAKKFERNYEKDKNIPEVLLILAKAYFANNIPEEGRKTLTTITSEYGNFNAAWKAVELEAELEEQASGISKAADLLAAKLSNDVPRTFEEPLRYKLAEYYRNLNRYDLAYIELKKLIEKFDSSADLDKYILFYSDCQLHLNKADELVKDKANFNKVFRESSLKSVYMLNISKAHLMLSDIPEAKTQIDDARKATNDLKTLYRCDRLYADILLKEGKISRALDLYKMLLNSSFADQNELLMVLGDIYFDKFSQFTAARKYYQRITTSYTEPVLLATAYFKIALCYEQQEKYNETIEELNQVNLEDLSDEGLKKKIENRRNYLIRFKQKDFENAFNSLMQTLLTYSENGNKQKMQNELVKIMANDLKEYDKTLQLLKGDNTSEGLYTKAKLYLNMIEKCKAESNTATLFAKITDLTLLIDKLKTLKKSEWIDEIELKKTLITAVDMDEAVVGKMETFIVNYPTSTAANEFNFLIFDFYKDSNYKKAADFAQNLQNDDTILEENYFAARIFLAEYFYEIDENEKALLNYQIAESYIDVFKPDIYFHYAVILNESGQGETAEQKLAFLVNNAGNYKNFAGVVDYYSNLLRNNGKFEIAVKAQLMLPEEQRNDKFWQKLSADYLELNDKENAKFAIMHIVEKDYSTLFQLGQLQFETDDLEMAKYTFGELVKQNKNDLKNHEYLGDIAFLQEEYLLAAQEYKIVVDKLGNNFSNYDGVKDLALQNIIALYRVENRPKAETLTKKFKNLFSAEEINDIELNRAVYHSKTDKKKAEKILSGLIKGKNVSIPTKIKSYFWRGVIYLEQNKLVEAAEDFSTVAGSVDQKMSNEAHLKLGTITFSQEKYPEALDHYYTVIENDQDGKLAFDAARNFAFVCKTIEEWQKAILAYEIIIERWGDQELEASTLFDIAFCHYRDKKYANAAEMFARSIPLLTESELKAEAQYWIGESYFGQELYETSVSEFLKVGYNYSEYAQWAASAELKAGEAYHRMNKIDKARRTYERIIDKYGRNSQWGSEAEKRLENL
jgi:TolA-binding protein